MTGERCPPPPPAGQKLLVLLVSLPPATPSRAYSPSIISPHVPREKRGQVTHTHAEQTRRREYAKAPQLLFCRSERGACWGAEKRYRRNETHAVYFCSVFFFFKQAREYIFTPLPGENSLTTTSTSLQKLKIRYRKMFPAPRLRRQARWSERCISQPVGPQATPAPSPRRDRQHEAFLCRSPCRLRQSPGAHHFQIFKKYGKKKTKANCQPRRPPPVQNVEVEDVSSTLGFPSPEGTFQEGIEGGGYI